MKLNKKGFAFSTMLYGTAALIAVVLYVVLNITKSSSDETYYYGEEILKSLNDCVTEEVVLENCYASGGSCDATSYHACLGISDTPGATKGVVIAEKLKETIGENGLVEDQYTNKRYIYQGNIVNNYIEYSGKIWRILSIESSGTLKLIDINASFNMAWDSNSVSEWDNSSLYNYLNGDYLLSLSDNSKIVKGVWNKAYIYPPSGESTYSIEDLVAQEKNRINETAINDEIVGMLFLSDYVKATTVEECKNKVFGNASCTSWLSDYKGWVIDIDANSSNTEENIGYAFFEDFGNKVNKSNTNALKNVYPVIYLDKNSVIISGDGTETNPYKIR